MWIKTKDGLLVNADTLSCINYVPEQDHTIGIYADDPFDQADIADGNVIPQIITALRRGDHYMGVQ